MGPPDFYAILGVAPASDEVVIRAAYKALMFKFHPDRNRTAEAERRAQAINEAFTILGDPRRRSLYDAHRAADARARMDAQRRPGPPPRRPPPSPPRGRSLARAPWRRLAQVRLPYWVTPRRAAAVGGTISLALAVHIATVAFAPAGLFASSAVRASTGDTGSGTSAYAAAGGTDGVLPGMTPPEVDFADVEQGAARFASAYRDGKMDGARSASQRCHAEIESAPSWRGADRCAAFDIAANAYDDAVAESDGSRADAYFLFAGRNPTALYHALTPDELLLQTRVARILQGTLPALQQAMWPSRRDPATHRIAARGEDAPDPAGPRPGYWTGRSDAP